MNKNIFAKNLLLPEVRDGSSALAALTNPGAFRFSIDDVNRTWTPPSNSNLATVRWVQSERRRSTCRGSGPFTFAV